MKKSNRPNKKPSSFEGKVITNCNPSASDSDWGIDLLDQADAFFGRWGKRKKSKAKADAIDWSQVVDLTSNKSWWRRAADQGRTGSCVGQAVGDVIWYSLVTKDIVPNHAQKHRPSKEYLWQASKETDAWTSVPTGFIDSAGTYIKDCLNVARKYGVTPEFVHPSFKGHSVLLSPAQYYEIASRIRIRAYYSVKAEGRDGAAHSTMRQWLLTQQTPIVARLGCDPAFFKANHANYELRDYDESYRYKNGHAVVIAGTKPGWLLIKNSWGKRWGRNGYVWMSDEYAAAALTEGYGVTV